MTRHSHYPPACPVCGASLPHSNPMSQEYHENVARRSQEREISEVFHKDKREDIKSRSMLPTDTLAYIEALEAIARIAFTVWTQSGMPRHAKLATEDALYNALRVVDFMQSESK